MPDLDRTREDFRLLLEQGFAWPAFVLVCAVIENLAAYASVLSRRRPEKHPLRELVRDLVVFGFASDDTKRKIDDALSRRNAILHDSEAPAPTKREVEALLKIGLCIQHELLALAKA